ncbi:hypothetical protein BGW36DRAFT_306301 [Talaromyces proteolyticus]|uniref:Amidohydrolase-related domain-containing protein n=1 Tax=Talaromyces proteolyticus TaxID=1131652 RepID=A0AAD4KF42_9EURO|nr:uncharacterized protein BGW36DRAFT_306301 [Talaromyces proteolyticus]KAH8690794.1 hypothetical protein BGW36DRAFT_306301 [Talaromyces proteolyticus]
MARTYLIRNGTVVSMDPSIGVVENCDVLIEGSKIAKIGPNIVTGDEVSVIDATNCIVSPGFVDTHRHTWQTQLRTITSNDTLFDYFVKVRNVYGSCYTPEDAYMGNYCGALESINSGITCLVDHCHIINSPAHSDAVVKGLKDAKIRGVFCYGLYQNPLHEGRCEGTAIDDSANPGWREADAARVRREHFPSNEKTDLLRFGFAPAEMERFPLPVTLDEVKFGRSLGAAIITGHISMGYLNKGLYLVRSMAKENLLGPDLLFSHGSALADDEIESLREAGSAISSTPDTELQMGMGQPVCFRAHKMDCHASLGAEAMGLEHIIGSITVGKRADILITSCDSLRLTPLHNPIDGLVLYANGSDIDTVLIDGEIVKQKGAFVHADWKAVGSRLRDSAKAIMERSKAISIERVRAKLLAVMGEEISEI